MCANLNKFIHTDFVENLMIKTRSLVCSVLRSCVRHMYKITLGVARDSVRVDFCLCGGSRFPLKAGIKCSLDPPLYSSFPVKKWPVSFLRL